MPAELISPTLALALVAYTVGVASPGPSILSIMSTAMTQGRAHALALAAGVMCGSLFWGTSAALGLSALLKAYSWSLVALKVLGGVYLLWLAYKAARTAWRGAALPAPTQARSTRYRHSFVRGLALHLTNPKAIFVWLSIVALALPSGGSATHALTVVASCAVIGLVVFFGYAWAFSTPLARRVYTRVARGFHAVLSGVFVYAGLRLLFLRAP